MFYETIDLYKEEPSLKRVNEEGGFLTVYSRSQSWEVKQKLRPAVLVIPGGAYLMVSEREAEPIALRFLNAGYAAFVLKYTVQKAYPTPLAEAAAAMKYIRENAEKYGVDPNHVCAVGFSAGGHLTGMLGTMLGDEEEKAALGASKTPLVPNAILMSYPVVVTDAFYTNKETAETISGGDGQLRARLSIEKRVNKDSAPAFIWHTTEDTCVPVLNSLVLAEAYRKCGVPFELHLFERGWHGLSTADIEVCDNYEQGGLFDCVAQWIPLALKWLEGRGFTVKNK